MVELPKNNGLKSNEVVIEPDVINRKLFIPELSVYGDSSAAVLKDGNLVAGAISLNSFKWASKALELVIPANQKVTLDYRCFGFTHPSLMVFITE